MGGKKDYFMQVSNLFPCEYLYSQSLSEIKASLN